MLAMVDAPEFTSLLRKPESSPEVASFSRLYAPVEIQKCPPSRQYFISLTKGTNILIEDGLVAAVQIYVQATKRYKAFKGVLPFGLKCGMKQDDVHALLGPPVKYDEFDSTYELHGGLVRVTICFQNLILKHISIGLPL